MSSKEVLDAEIKDVSSYTKERLRKLLITARITMAATIIIVLGAFQQVSAQSDSTTKSIAQKIADAQTEPEFRKLTEKQRQEKLIGWINGLSDKIQEQLLKKIKEGKLYEAEKDLEFYERIRGGIEDSGLEDLLMKLREILEEEKTKKNAEQQTVIDKIRHNKIGTGNIQEINGVLYATFTDANKELGAAQSSSSFDLDKYVRKNNLKTNANNHTDKITKENGIMTVTSFIPISDQ